MLIALTIIAAVPLLDPLHPDPPPSTCDAIQTQDAWRDTFSPLSPMAVSAPYWKTPETSANPFVLSATTAEFTSEILGASVNYVIWKPPTYRNHPDRQYPVVYFLPGSMGQPWQVGAFLQHLRVAVDKGLAPEMIVVGVNAVASPAYYIDAVGGELPLESVIVEELIPHIDATYRTRPQRRYRAVEGYSLGGFGALHLALKYPDTFAAASSLAGYLLTPRATLRATQGQTAHGVWCHWLNASPQAATHNSVFTQLEHVSSETLANLTVRLGYGEADSHDFIEHAAKRARDILTEHGYPPAAFIAAPGVWHSDIAMYDRLGPEGFLFYLDLFAPVVASRAGLHSSEHKHSAPAR